MKVLGFGVCMIGFAALIYSATELAKLIEAKSKEIKHGKPAGLTSEDLDFDEY